MNRWTSAFLVVMATALSARADLKPSTSAVKKADSEATKLLADARAARVNWSNFPGLTADIAVNIDGKITRGRVVVSHKGKLKLELKDPDALTWTKGVLGSTIGHRLDDSASLKTPCAFPDDNASHP